MCIELVGSADGMHYQFRSPYPKDLESFVDWYMEYSDIR